MGRRRTRKTLAIWMNGLQVGSWTLDPTGGHEFVYARDWFGRAEARPLSLSMPLRTSGAYRGVIVEEWFDNLLPDSRDIRQRLQSRFHTASSGAFDLLAEIGRDCVGAVQLLPEGAAPDDIHQIQGEPLSDHDVANILRAAPVSGVAGDENTAFRISLAGAQEKTALLWHEGRWARPIGATPTTHIFKLPLGRVGNFQGDLSTSVENEWLCSKIVAAFGLPIAATAMGRFEDQGVLIVERFDRRLSSDKSYWLRLPQEDLCQAMGVPRSMKYEADGGPGIRPIMSMLLGSRNAEQDRLRFLKAQIVFWLLCGIDGHAKNFSIALETENKFGLTPLYDVMSAWPLIGHGKNQLAIERAKMAMAVISRNRHYRWRDIQPRHWLSTARACGVDEASMKAVIEDLVACAPAALVSAEAALPHAFPEHVSVPIFDGVRQAAERLETVLHRK